MSQVRQIWCAALVGCSLGGASAAFGAPITDPGVFGPGLTTEIDFESDGNGNAVNLIAGEVRLLPAGEYSSLGISFDRDINWVRDGNAAFQAALFLGGSPRNGIPSAAVNEFEVIYTDPVQAFGFFVVHNSTLDPNGPTFTAFDSMGNVIETVTFASTVPGGGSQIPNATFVRYGFLGIDAGGATIKRVRITKSAAVLDNLTFAETLVEPIGACCFESVLRETNIFCEDEITRSDCIENGGVFAGDGTLCSEVDCESLIPRGACCLENVPVDLAAACFDNLTELECTTLGGTYAGDDTLCEDVNCDELLELGACCFEVFDGPELQVVCQDGLTEQECVQEFRGVFAGIGTTCMNTDCGEVLQVGACCFGTVCVDEITEASCLDDGGVFQGVGTDCSTNPCGGDPTGACCFPDGTCQELTESECISIEGTYRGDETTCADGSCLGACCIAGGDQCIEGVDIATCQQQFEGVFQGFGVPCSESECVGACCVGACECVSFVDRVTCEGELEGTYAGNMTSCDNPSICAPECADANNDGRVDSIDLGILLAEFNQPASATPFQADFNCDGRVDSIDLGILLAQFNLTCDQVVNGDRNDGRQRIGIQSVNPMRGQSGLLRGTNLRPTTIDDGMSTSAPGDAGAGESSTGNKRQGR